MSHVTNCAILVDADVPTVQLGTGQGLVCYNCKCPLQRGSASLTEAVCHRCILNTKCVGTCHGRRLEPEFFTLSGTDLCNACYRKVHKTRTKQSVGKIVTEVVLQAGHQTFEESVERNRHLIETEIRDMQQEYP